MTVVAVRRLAALAAIVVGAIDLAGAATRHPLHGAGFVGIDYAASAVIGARYVLLVAGLVLIGLARSLRHGKRTALWLALVASLTSAPGHHVKDADIVGMVAAGCLVVILLLGRSAFRARSDPLLLRRGIQVLALGEAVVFAYGVLGLYFLDAQFRSPLSFTEALENGSRLLFLLPTSSIQPATRHGGFFVDSVRVAALGVALVGIARLVSAVVLRPGSRPAERARVVSILERNGRTALAHFHLLDDKLWFFSADDRAFIGYKLVGTTAVALGEPIGPRDSCVSAAVDFVEYCDGNGWVPAFHQVTEEGRAILIDAGLRSLKIGEEAIVDVQTFDLNARQHKNLRSALRRVERAGLHVIEFDSPLADATIEQLRDVSDAWLESGHHRERTFTLGRFDPTYLRETSVVAMADGDGDIAAFANILPTYQAPDGNFDLMRRRPDAPNGTMDALFVGLINRFRAEGKRGMNLGLAPLANITGDTLPDRALRFLYERGNRAFNFDGLRHFKAKWEPCWEARYLAYRSDGELPRVAAAVARAGELPDPRSTWARAGALARRVPVSLAIFGVALWLMAVTRIDPQTHRHLTRAFALGWHDVVHLQLWRLATSELLQDRPGFLLGNLALLAIALPIAELRIGSPRTALVFALGDWLSTLPTVASARLLGALGNDAALHAALHRDSGSSSGTWATIAAILTTLPQRNARRLALAAMFTYLAARILIVGREFDVQHLLAAVAALGIMSLLQRRDRRTAATDAVQSPGRAVESV